LRLSEFDFVLPAERIAQHPAQPRDAARLLHVHPDGLADYRVRDLPSLLRPGDVLVVNDTRVIPAQLEARRGGARVGITLDRPLGDGAWQALARNTRRLHAGDRLTFEGNTELEATVLERGTDGSVVLRFNREGADLTAALHHAGALALPP
jgi:S-adenosylmethionine:tRNA ribosyltransferase-isomerase